MKTVAIVGKAQKTRGFTPYDNPEIDVWGYQDFVFKHMPRVTGMLEMHPDWFETDRYTSEYKAWLQLPHDFPIWMHEVDPRIPASVKYPLEDVTRRYMNRIWKGSWQRKYFFTSSTPYAIALAGLLGYQRIELYGIELAAEDGYSAERDCVFFWMGNIGAEIVIHEQSELMEERLYPFY